MRCRVIGQCKSPGFLNAWRVRPQYSTQTRGAIAGWRSMEELTRRAVLRAALAAPALLDSLRGETPEHQDHQLPKRFEEVAGFEIAGLASTYQLAIVPLGSLEFHGPHNPVGADSIIISGIADHVA